MYFTCIYSLNSYRIYRVSRRLIKGLSVFPFKRLSDYLDYSIDFSQRLSDGEDIVGGEVSVNSDDVVIENVYGSGCYLTAFISGGLSGSSYYLTYTAQTNQGNVLSQEMILPTFGKESLVIENDKYLALRPDIKPLRHRPPLNAVKLNDRYLLDDNGFFIGIL